VAQIESDELDIGLWCERVQAPSLVMETIYEDRLMGAIWKGSEALGDAPTLEEFDAMRCVGYNYAAVDWRGLEGARCLSEGHHGVMHANALSTFERLVLLRDTDLVTAVPETLGRRLAPQMDIRLFNLPFKTQRWGEMMLWHPRRMSDPAHVWIRAQLKQIAMAQGLQPPTEECDRSMESSLAFSVSS
jgi:DNA-binding transcriptional LysR family regulator